MIIPDYEVGQNVHLKPFQSGADGIRCVCNPDKESGLQAPAITAPELGDVGTASGQPSSGYLSTADSSWRTATVLSG